MNTCTQIHTEHTSVLKFQQSFVVFFKVPRLQFIDRVLVTSVAS